MSCSFDISKDQIGYYWSLVNANAGAAGTGPGLIIVLFKSAALQADSAMADNATLAAIKASNTEADFTNYVRKTVQGTTATLTRDTTADQVVLSLPDQTWVAAGGAANNTLGKSIICYKPLLQSSTDAQCIPLLAHDLSATTDGNDLITKYNATTGATRVV